MSEHRQRRADDEEEEKDERASSRSEKPTPQSNATNAQKNKNSPNAQESDTSCVHGHTIFVQYLMNSSYANAAALKADSFANHVRVTGCNCTLT